MAADQQDGTPQSLQPHTPLSEAITEQDSLSGDVDQSVSHPRRPSHLPHRLSSAHSHSTAGRSSMSDYANIDELAAPPPVENPYERRWYRHESIEDRRSPDPEYRRKSKEKKSRLPFSKLRSMNMYNVSNLIFFSILGTLARLGLQALTTYPNAPVIMSEVWANVGGSFILGFLQEDKAIFSNRRSEAIPGPTPNESETSDTENAAQTPPTDNEKKSAELDLLQVKKTLPPYIGLTVGFCGSFTSFSALIRDAFLALSNDLLPANPGAPSRHTGYSAAAVTAVLIAETGLSLAALSSGAHFALACAPILSRFPNTGFRRLLNPLMLLLGPGCWLGAVLLAIWPVQNVWRGEVVFALVFAPIGCLMRFALALTLNGISSMFPFGTFAANVFGSWVLAMCFDLQRSSSGQAVVSCQVLQGVEDGFSGCLTTVSTWVAELKGLRRRHAYTYGAASLGVSFAGFLIIVGSLRWTMGFDTPLCKV
ncbi:putative chromosome condensation protein [Rhizodiscina lignyota]|uniref:Chromosome condensation protein n=1 Tax=Rhizodiscina lignyota TaxID=1504668 RepID=A0A9P4M371_9PEZI|nr:putative chromosome condensation protein [Rhizodiscina lignyota]